MSKQVAPMSLAFKYLSFEYNIAIVKWKLHSFVLFWRNLPLFYAFSHGIVEFWVAFATFWLSIILSWVKTNIMRDYCHLGVSNIFFTNFFLFFRSFFALFRSNQRPGMGVKILLTSNSNFFWYLNNISYHIELGLSHFLQTLSIEKLSKILGSNGPRTG